MTTILKQVILIGLLFSILFWLSSCQDKAEPDHIFVVTAETTAQTPISPLLYSHFIEIGFGYQISPIMAELFFNRSFEEFPPYNGKSKNSFGLLLEEGEYITDWSGEAWYHSGYEHNSWFAAPGKANDPAIIKDENTYFIDESPMIDVRLQEVQGSCGHGVQCVRVINNEHKKWGGLAQDGKYLEKGKTYHFSGFLKYVSGSKKVEIRLYQEGNWEKPLFSKKITLTKEYKKYTCEIPYSGPTAQVTFAVYIAPQSSIEADAFSLMPVDNYYGWKKSTVEALKKVNPGLIRFPGGCFASFYQWKHGVGPKDQRKPEPSYFWGGLNNNDFGTAEFAKLCDTLGAEMMFCVNMYLPEKKNYLNSQRNPWQYRCYELDQITDPEKGLKNAVDWVAYCNLKEGEHPMADWRVKHGFKEPFGVKYWEMDNELCRWLSAEEYAREVVKYSKAMKAVDPDIKIGMVTYDYTGKIPEMLEIAGKHIDFFADRDDEGKGRLDNMIALLNDFNTRNGTQIKYCNTEWQVHPYGAENPKEKVDSRFLYGHKTKIKRSIVLGTWYCVLKAAGYLMDWQRKGNIVNFVNFNNLANTHGQAIIETPKEEAYLTAPGRLYELISRTPARWPLNLDNYEACPNDMIQAQASYSLHKDTLVLYALNRTDTTTMMGFDLSGLNRDFSQVQISILDADDIFARNKINMQDEIRRTKRSMKVKDDLVKLQCPPRSFIHAVLPGSEK